MSNVGSERRKAVALAWKNEKGYVMEGKGTRDWNQKEQREIISKGKVKGYQGHHMKSVDGHNSKAGDPNNIQFLTRSEHLAAHKGNYRNNTNGYYDPKSKTINEFGRNKASVETKKLSQPLNKSQKRYAAKKANEIIIQKKAKAREKRLANKHNMSKSKSSVQKNATSKSVRSKTLANQRTSTPTKASNTATKSKTLSAQRASTLSKGKNVSTGKNTMPRRTSGEETSGCKGVSGGRCTSGGKGHGR